MGSNTTLGMRLSLSAEWIRAWTGYLLAASVSLWLTGGADVLVAIWLPNALVVMQFARMDARGAAPFAIVLSAALLAFVIGGMQPLPAVILALSHAAQVSATIWVARVWLGPGLPEPSSPECQLQYFSIVALAMPLLIGLAAGPAVALATGWDILATIHEFIVGQLLGAAIVVPLMMYGR